MGANHCGVNHDLFHISIYCKGIENHLPHNDFGPSYQPFVNLRPFPVRFWQFTPQCIFAGNPYRYQYVLNPLLF
nr:hypothetical protein [Holospora curviuscula]